MLRDQRQRRVAKVEVDGGERGQKLMDELADIASTRLVAASDTDKVLRIVKKGHYVFQSIEHMLGKSVAARVVRR